MIQPSGGSLKQKLKTEDGERGDSCDIFPTCQYAIDCATKSLNLWTTILPQKQIVTPSFLKYP